MSRQDSKTAAAVTIGCRLNQADTALIFKRLRKVGYSIVEADKGDPDLLVVNSCSVTSSAARKSRQAVRKLRRKYPKACIIITGCSTEVERDFWLNDENADIFLPGTDKSNILDYLEDYAAGIKSSDISKFSHDDNFDWKNSEHEVFREGVDADYPFRSRAFLKIQEGCNSFCSYCIVPYARGRERSRDWNEVCEAFERLVERGFKEIIITGVNISTYNCNGKKLSDLIEYLAGRDGDFRIRLSSTEPHTENINLIDIMAENSKICRFLHLPLQHGSDRVLQLMNRPYTTENYEDFVKTARNRIPDIHIGTDVIVGFPGETEELFIESYKFIEKISFANVHVFSYSKREGTPAADFDGHVPPDEVKKRYKALASLCAQTSSTFSHSQLGKELEVLVEKVEPGVKAEGWSDNYLRVEVLGKFLEKNNLVNVIVESQLGGNRVLGVINQKLSK